MRSDDDSFPSLEDGVSPSGSEGRGSSEGRDSSSVEGGSGSSFEDRVVSELLSQLALDQASGSLRAPSEYLARFPEHEERVVGELARFYAPRRGEAESGQRVGPYRLIRELGVGGQGTVWEAEDTRMARRVALKVLNLPALASEPSRLRRLRREAELLSRLNHPSICRVFDADFETEPPYLAMALVEGETVRARITRQAGRRTTEHAATRIASAVALVRACAEALHAAHELGLVHRDIKPGNVIVTADERPVVLDFGMARELTDEQVSLTRSSELLGTPAYLPPESLGRNARELDARADVYQLGLTLYELVTLMPAHRAPTWQSLYQSILDGGPARVRMLEPAASRDLELVIATAMEREPERRYQSARALADDLARIERGEPILARPLPPHARFGRWARAHPALATATAALFLFLAVGWSLTARLLDRARTERDSKELALEQLRETVGFGDSIALRSLRRELPELAYWPAAIAPGSGTVDSDAWLARARPLSRRLDEYRAALERTQNEVEAGATLDDESEWVRDTQARFVAELLEFQHELEHVEARLATARSLGLRSRDGWLDAWAGVDERVRADRDGGRYHSPRIERWRDLIPLGPDPQSGLEEFALLSSGAPPARDPDSGLLAIGPDTALVLVLLPAGHFEMGSEPTRDPDARDDEGPVHLVELDAFYLSKYELTQGQWKRLTGEVPSYFPIGETHHGVTIDGRHPVEWVPWEEATRALEPYELFLPTEAQWEYAARAGTTSVWWTGDDPRSFEGAANLFDRLGKERAGTPESEAVDWLDDGHVIHAPVGLSRANAFGLHDVIGNVVEWCRDAYGPYDRPPRPGDGLRAEQGDQHVLRGGSFNHTAERARSAHRSREGRFWGLNIGIRPSRPLER